MNKIFADGSGWSGKESKYCVVTNDNPGYLFVTEHNKTNNEMEYQAVFHAFQIASNHDEIYTDSALVVNQLIKNWKINHEHLKYWNDKIKEIWETKPNVTLHWISRNDNKAGKILEKINKKR